ncbi:MAG TPA: hypothetical protein VGI75_13710, partial [Pirellulales bacterium]
MSIWSHWLSHALEPLRRQRLPRASLSPPKRRRRGFESLESRRVLSVNSNFLAGTLTINLTGADTVAITAAGGNVQLTINGLAGFDPDSGVLFAGDVNEIDITGLGNFNNTIDLTALNKADFGALSTILLNGGDGSDTYKLDQSILPAAVVSVNDTGLTGADSLQLGTTSAGPETINVSSLNVGRSSHPTVGYTGIESLNIDGAAAADTINVASTAAGTQTTINAGTGLDTLGNIDLTSIGAAGLTINTGGDGESLIANAATAGTLSISSTQIQRTGNGAITYNGLSSLTVNGTAGIDTFNVASTAAGTQTTINAGTGLDIFGNIDLTSIGAAGLTISAGGDGESLTANTAIAGTVSISSTQVQHAGDGALTYSGLSGLNINGTSSADTFNIASTA